MCCLQSVIIFIYALVPWRSGQRQCDTPTTIGLGLRSCEATRVTWPHVNEGIGSCKLVLVCKMRITGGPGPGFAQQQQQSDHILHPATSILPWPGLAVAGQNKLDTALTRGDHGVGIVSTPPPFNIQISILHGPPKSSIIMKNLP